MGKAVAKTPARVGNNVLVKTVLPFYTGRIVSISKEEIVLERAAWIADTGRFSEALARGRDALNEVEIVPPGKRVAVQRGAIISILDWHGDLPEATK